jgi:phosphoglycolate phosphatase
MTGVRNVFFDLDGTLLDSRLGILDGLRRAMWEMGHELPDDMPLDWAVGPPLAEVMARLLAGFGDGRVDEAVARYRAWYGASGLFDARVYPGVPELLDRLAGCGMALFVSTAKTTDFARRMLEHFDLARFFRAIQGAEPDGRFQHKPELVRFLLSSGELTPAETVLVGDREHDVRAAHANGLRAVGAAYGYGGRAELLAAGAEVVCDTPAEVADLLAGGGRGRATP